MNFDYKTIGQAGKEAYDYMVARHEGTIRSLKTGWEKFDKETLDGLEWHTIMMVCGMSGSGKIALLNQLETNLYDMNPKEEFISVSNNFEMLARTLMIRKMSTFKQMSMKQLLSAETDFKLTAKDLAEIQGELKAMSRYNIFYIDQPKTIAELKYIVQQFWLTHKKPMVISLDHTLLIKRSSSDLNTTDMLYNLGEALNEMKKLYPVIFIIASQLNRDIEDVDRMKRPSALQFPKKSDISYADAIYQFSDIVLINHRPSQLNITHYGPERWEVTENDIFWHILKNRQGSTPILKMIADFKHMRIVEDLYFETKLTG